MPGTDPSAGAHGHESAWDYPRPPRLKPVAERLRVVFGGEVVADTASGFRVLETSHPPTYYFPPGGIRPGVLVPEPGASLCEWKGRAVYFKVVGGGRRAPRAAWAYPDPSPAFRALAGHVAFYPAPMDACFVGEERVAPQPGGFYGGRVTSRVVGPIKSGPGSGGW